MTSASRTGWKRNQPCSTGFGEGLHSSCSYPRLCCCPCHCIAVLLHVPVRRGGCSNEYRDAQTHEGYTIVKKWRDARHRFTEVARAVQATQHRLAGEELQAAAARLGPDEHHEPLPAPATAGAFFSFTSNVDAHHLRHFAEGEVRECHGNTESWQCGDRDCARRQAASASGSCCEGGRWAAPEGHRFRVDPATQLAHPGSPAAPASAEVGAAGAPRPSRPMRSVDGTEPPQETLRQWRQADWAAAFGSNQPRCVLCGGPARPAILMFSDASWQDDEAQEQRWATWQAAVVEEAQQRSRDGRGGEPPLKVAILEVGAGGNVTTVRGISEGQLDELRGAGATATLIRINPDLPLADDSANQRQTISLCSYGLAALRKIDTAMACLPADGSADATPLHLSSVRLPSLPDPSVRARSVVCARSVCGGVWLTAICSACAGCAGSTQAGAGARGARQRNGPASSGSRGHGGGAAESRAGSCPGRDGTEGCYARGLRAD